MNTVRPISCERSRVWAALLPDGELSQLEKRILEVHLARCADCARHAEQIAAIVAVVRDTPSESCTSPVGMLRRPRFGWGKVARATVGGSAVAAAVVLAISVVSLQHQSSPAQPSAPLIVVGSADTELDGGALWRQTQNAKRLALLKQSRGQVFGNVLS